MKIQTSGKWNCCGSIPLQNLLDSYYHLTVGHMDKKMEINVGKKVKINISSRVYVKSWIESEWGNQEIS